MDRQKDRWVDKKKESQPDSYMSSQSNINTYALILYKQQDSQIARQLESQKGIQLEV